MMMKNLSMVDEMPGCEGLSRLANHTSVQELANTLLADPMSLFRRRKNFIRSLSPLHFAGFKADPPAHANATTPEASGVAVESNVTAAEGERGGGGTRARVVSQNCRSLNV